MRSAIQSGDWVHRPPLGYISANCPGGLALDPDRANLIRLAFEIYAEGSLSAADILRKVTDLGLRTVKNAPVSAQSFDNLLSNPVYGGLIRIPSWGIEAK